MMNGIGIARQKLIDKIITENFSLKDPREKQYKYLELLYIIQEMLDEEGKKYHSRGLSKRGHNIFREFIKYLLYRNIANYDSFILITSVKGCLYDETLIKTQEYGNISIKSLVEDKKDLSPLLYSIDKKTKKIIKSVGFIVDSGEQECFKIKTKSGKEIIATNKHKFFIEKNGIIEEIKLKDLKKGDKIVAVKDDEEIEAIEFIGLRKTYDFHVPEYNNFILGNDILSHNSGKSSAAMMIARQWCKLLGIQFKPKTHIAYNNQDVMRLIKTLPKFAPIVADEGGRFACFPDYTVVTVELNGKQQDIMIKDLMKHKDFKILSYNTETNRTEFKTNGGVIFTGKKQVYKLEFDNGETIECTEDHLFLVKRFNKLEWIKAKNIKGSDDIMYLKKCEICGNLFEQKTSLHKTCSSKCSYELHKKKSNDYHTKKYHLLKNDEDFIKRKNEISKKYRENNKDKIKIRKQAYKDRNKDNIQYKMKNKYLKRLREGIVNKFWSTDTQNIVGCTLETFRNHIEEKLRAKNMTFENYGVGEGKWCIDHIKPISSFDLSNEKELKECFNYRNLQPLDFLTNSRKGEKYNG